MKKLIVYGSQYGSSKAYAEKFSQLTEIPAVSYAKLESLQGCEMLIYFGGLYAGGVTGLPKILKALPRDTKLILATVGLADVQDQENTDHIKEALHRQVPEDILSRTEIFHLRGGIDYGKLSFLHKTMMSLLYKKVKKLPEEEQNAEIRAMIETFGKKVDFIDFSALQPLLDAVK